MTVRLVVVAIAMGLLTWSAAAQTPAPQIPSPAPQEIPVAPPAVPDAPAPQEIPVAPPAVVDAPAPQAAPAVSRRPIDFAVGASVLELRTALSTERVSDPSVPDALWFTLDVVNNTNATVTRVLLAEDPPRASLAVMPASRRATLVGAAGSDAQIVVERARAFGPAAFRVSVPAMHAGTLALYFQGVSESPSVLAWTESALIAHNRQSAVLAGVVAGLLAAAAAFAAGAAALAATPKAKWSAAFLTVLLFSDLVAAGVFDNGWLTDLSGPSALFAFALSLTVAAGIRLIDVIAPLRRTMPFAASWRDRVAVVVLIIGVAALLRVPATALTMRAICVSGAALAAGYLAQCGRLGHSDARHFAPAATILALVTAAAAFHALGLLPENLVAPAAIGGFSAAGAMLIALASAAMVETVPPVSSSRAQSARDLSPSPPLAMLRNVSAIAASHQGVFDLDLESGSLALSSDAAKILGLPAEEATLSREAWRSRIHAEDRAVYDDALAAYRKDVGLAFRIEFRARGANAMTRWLELRATMIGDGTEAEHCLGLIADVTARRSAEAEHFAAVRNDALTGLGNRIALVDFLEEPTTKLQTVTLAVLDLDRFKAVNASLGPEGADAMLCDVAARLTEHFTTRAQLFRMGGDMFAIIPTAQNKDIAAFGDEILAVMRPPFMAASREIYLPASIGLAAGVHAADPLDLLSLAELAMIQAKRDGGECVRIYAPAMREIEPANGSGDDPLALESNLRRAMEKGEIEIHYQPIMRLQDGGIAGFEALMRWRDADRGFIDPERFLPQVEETGLILPLGRLALKRAAEDLARWQQFFPLKPPLFVSVNVSWRQLTDEGFARDLEGALKNGVASRSLKLEITERAVMHDIKVAQAALKKFRALGAGLAIDDFGTGQSSLSHLQNFPFDVIKIDKSFLAAGGNGNENAILDTIVKLAHGLGLQVVVEGIETEKDATRLRAMGCEFGQGFHFGQALPPAEVTQFIAMTYTR